MTDAVRVRPRTGLILDGIPSDGAEIPAELADEWMANQMVVPAGPSSAVRRHLGAVIVVMGPVEYTVGEAGPETFVPPTPAPRQRAMKPRRTRSDKGKQRRRSTPDGR